MKKIVPLLITIFVFAQSLFAQTTNSPVVLRVVTTETATHVNATIIAYNFEKIIGFQFSVNWNPDAISTPTHTSVLPGIISNLDTNNARFVWVSNDGKPTNIQNTPILVLTFVKNSGQNPNVNVVNSPTPIEFVGDDNKVRQVTILSNTSNTPSLKGRVFVDTNKDCQINTSDTPFKNRLIKATNPTEGDFYGFSDAAGDYEIYLLNNSVPYEVSVLLDTMIWKSCQPKVTVSNPSQAANQSIDFPVRAIIDCEMNNVKVNNSILRRCFSNTYQVVCSNTGTLPSQNTYVVVTLDDDFILESADVPFSTLGNGQYRFDLGTLAVDEYREINLTIKLSCDGTVLGQTHCFKAEIFPNTPCDLGRPIPYIKASCENGKVNFVVENQGFVELSNANYIVIEDDMIFKQAILPTLSPKGLFNTETPANGSTWRLEIRKNNELLSATFAEGCGTNSSGNFSIGHVQSFKLLNPSNSIAEICRPSVGAYDPNDKQGFPTGFGNKHYIEQNIQIEYLIRFQNTGTDTAFNVVVEDVIDDNLLDIGSIRLLGASHKMSMDVKNRNTLVFDFKNIMLPDSFVSEKNSHGFIRFVIDQKRDLKLGSVVKNKAAIFFDFNAPVITNETYHTIGKDFLLVKSQEVFMPNVNVNLSPNPMKEVALLLIEGMAESQELRLEIMDMNGRVVQAKSSTTSSFDIYKGELNEGIFIYKIISPQGIVAVGKFIVQ